MTTPKINTFHPKGSSSRYYIHPTTGDKVPGVTSVLNMLPKPFLKAWAAKEVATSAIRSLDGSGADWLSPMVADDPEGAIDYLKRSPDRNTRKAADIGTAGQGVFGTVARGEPLGPITDDLKPFADHYKDFLDTVQPTVLRTEDTVWSEKHAYAGSFDALMEIKGVRGWVDNRTTRSGEHP